MTTKTCGSAALAALLGVALSGCGNVGTSAKTAPGDAFTTQSDTADSPGTLAPSSGADAGVAYPLTNAASADLAGTATAFATRNALYEPVRFADLPGWSTDNVVESWDAFRRSCGALGAKPGWSAPCTAAKQVDGASASAVRRFFEQNFTVYQIRNVDRTARGVLTGYYEPTLNGSRRYGSPYVYPVYGVPRDMLFLDQRLLPPNARGTAVAARIENRSVVPLASVSTGSIKGVYALELRDSVPDIRDKKLRLRLDGNRIVPYYSRAEIERGRLNAPVLAYVDDPAMLYSMQLQGAGRIRMPDGTTLRLAYAEQNGFAFNPPVASASSKGRKILVRGVEIDVDEGADGPQDGSQDGAQDGSEAGSQTGRPDDAAPQSALLRDARPPGGSAASDNADAAADAATDAPASPLLRGFNLAKTAAPAGRPARATSAAPSSALSSAASSALSPVTPAAYQPTPPTGKPMDKPMGKPLDKPAMPYTFASSDPSYVFFRTVPDSTAGPLGALGVPLSAGRSAAIDPRTTPLGAPVYVATGTAGAGAPSINRLLMAQDAGGAIRGAVRADFFFGSGPQAGAQASKMKQPAQMWVLLPKGLKIAAKDSRVRVRGGSAPLAQAPDCIVSDPELCVEEPR